MVNLYPSGPVTVLRANFCQGTQTSFICTLINKLLKITRRNSSK